MRLNYQSYGEGPPLVILHGLLGSLDNWHTLSKRFASRFLVFALDQRNHGRSPHSDEFNYRVMVEDLLEFIESRRISPINLIGHSMGGKTAMQFALTYPEAVEKLIVADISPRAYPSHHDFIIDALCSLDLKRFQSRNEVESALAVKIPDSAVRGFLLKNLMRDETNAFAWKANLDAIKKNFDEINRSIDSASAFVKPALFIRGEKSNYVLDEDELLIKRIFPQATIETISGAGHWVHADAPEEFFAKASDFLSV